MECVNLVVGIMGCLIAMACTVDAYTHIVGGSNGWRVPPSKTFFQDWADNRTFGVGDSLVFPYRPGANNLVVVKKEDFETCGQNDVIYMYFLGPTIVNFTAAGDHFYYCGIGKHCEAGQKFHIHVGSATGSAGSDPLPFKLETIGFNNIFSNDAVSVHAPAPAPAANSSAAAALVPAGLLAVVSLVSAGLFL